MKLKLLGCKTVNPAEIRIHASEIQSKLLKYSNQHYKYCFIVNPLLILISSSIAQETKVIF